MAAPKEKQLKPANKEKQILRQEQVNKLQQENQNKDIEDKIPQLPPIEDKYIFGLGNNNDNHQQQENEEEEEEEINNYKTRYLPHDWSEVWDKQEFIETSSGGKFCCYSAGIKNNNLIFVCLHGCGHSALSYSLIAKLLKDKYQIFSFDYRGHGLTTFNDDDNDNKDNQNEEEEPKNNNELSMNDYFKKHFNGSGLPSMKSKKDKSDGGKSYKMSKDNLVSDIIEIVKSKYGTDDPPPIVLVGHSLGGALAVHTAQIKGMLLCIINKSKLKNKK